MVGSPIPISPAVVDLGAAASNLGASKDDPLSVSAQDIEKSLAINTTSPFVAAQQAVLGFAQLPASASRTFIYTGNMLNQLVSLPGILSLGVGKSATGHIIQTAAEAYKSKGYK